MADPKLWHVGLIGYGEVGRILAEDLRAQGVNVTAYDLKLDHADTAEALRSHAQAHGVSLSDSHAELAAHADFIVSAVTASQTELAALACAAAIRPEVFSSTSTRPPPAPDNALQR